MTKETDRGADVHSTLGFLIGVLQSIQITEKHMSDPEEALKRILKDVDRGLNQYELYKEARMSS